MNDCKNKQDMIDGANPGDCEHLPLGTLRRTGIDLIGDVPWGTHFCQFYQTKQDLIDILVPYFKTGLENNEFCMWVTSEPLGVDEAKASLKAVVPNLDRYLDNEQIEIISYTDWYVKDGGFERNRVLNGWVEKLNAALERGLDGLRLTGNTFWLEKSDWDDFTYYEQVVNEVIGNYKMLAICTYSLEKCGGVEVADVVSNHQFSLMKREGRWTIIESSEHKRTEQAQDALQNAMEKLAVANETLASNNEELTALNEELEVANEELRVSSDELLKEVERRRLAEESMRSLALFPDENPFPVLRVSSNGTILYANRASNPLLKEWGREAGERVPVNLHSLIREALDSNSNKIIDIDCEDRVSSFVFAPIPDQGYVNLYGRDVTERRHAEDEREISVEFLRLMNESAGTPELIRAAATFFQDKSGCKAVGIRLKDGDDYPYYVAQGFPREFVLLENSLCERDCDGGVIRDNSGYPICECMCGNVIQGRFDPSKPFFTEHGSFWTNCTTNLIATTEADRQARPRNRCNGEGYESVALIPIHLGDERLGLIQLNDRQKGRFTPEIIAFWERLADYLAVALAKFQAEEALRKSERRLNRSQEIAHLGSWELDLVKNELTWSDEVYRIFGLQPQEFAATYEAFLDVVHPDDRTAVDEAYSSSVREGKSTYEIQHRVVRKSTGEVRWVHERCEHIRDESGNIIRSIGMVMDITDRKRSEQELELAHAETERRAAELETFIESMGDAVALFDVQGKIVLANDAAMRMLGAPAGIPLGEVSQKYRLYTTDGDPLPVEMYPTRRALRGEKRSEARCKFVTPWTEGVVHITASPVRDTAGGIVGVVTISRDVREQVEFERQREEVYQREHRIADILQKALIPEVSYEIPGYDIAVRYEPALKEAEVGGDFYDIFDLGEGRMGALIGDVVGKGLPAAIRVAAARHAIRSYAYLDPRPSRVMTLANDALSRDEAGDASMLTAFFAVIDTRLGAVTYANGGHETTIIRRSDGTIEELSTDGRALGVFEGFIYSEGSELLRPGDTIVMMTDGITEARPSPIALFGIERVKDYLNRTRQTSPEEIADGLLKAAKKHAAGSLSDDAAVVVIQVKKEPTRKTR